MSNSLRPCGLQHARLPCPALSLGICSNSRQLSWWSHPIISSSVTPLSSWSQSFPASGSFPMSWLFALAGQGIGALAPVLPMNIQGWFCLGFTDLTPCSPRNSQESSPAPQFESINSLAFSLPYGPTLTSIHQFSSVQFSCSVLSNCVTSWTAARLVSLSITNSWSLLKCPLSWWSHPIISSSVVPFSSCLQSFPASGSFLLLFILSTFII